MDLIASRSFWIGHAGNGCAARSICDRGIEAVLQLATEEPVPHLPREILQFRISINGTSQTCRERLIRPAIVEYSNARLLQRPRQSFPGNCCICRHSLQSSMVSQQAACNSNGNSSRATANEL